MPTLRQYLHCSLEDIKAKCNKEIHVNDLSPWQPPETAWRIYSFWFILLLENYFEINHEYFDKDFYNLIIFFVFVSFDVLIRIILIVIFFTMFVYIGRSFLCINWTAYLQIWNPEWRTIWCTGNGVCIREHPSNWSSLSYWVHHSGCREV